MRLCWLWGVGLGVDELVGDLVDVSGAHGDDEVAGLGDEFELFGDGVEGVDVHGGDALLPEF